MRIAPIMALALLAGCGNRRIEAFVPGPDGPALTLTEQSARLGERCQAGDRAVREIRVKHCGGDVFFEAGWGDRGTIFHEYAYHSDSGRLVYYHQHSFTDAPLPAFMIRDSQAQEFGKEPDCTALIGQPGRPVCDAQGNPLAP